MDQHPASPAPAGLVVVGMHRSGTSLVTSLLGACGWRLGEQMLKPGKGNPRGYFEDREVHNLHKRMLAAYKLSWDDVDGLRDRRPVALPIPPKLAGEADRLVEAYRSGGPWVWKNPRATLFLPAWAERLPEARFVLCVRDPAAVADSMLRRKDTFGVGKRRRFYRERRLARALDLWHSYNLGARDFAMTHPDRVCVVRVPDDLPVLSRGAGQEVFEADLLHRPRRKVELAARLALPTRRLYHQLRGLARPDLLAEIVAGPTSAVRTEAAAR